jgi:uncharacterized phage protein (TIGR02220 family)
MNATGMTMAIPRIRSVKPEFWDDEKLGKICRDARLTFIGMWTFADDRGVVRAHSVFLKNKIFPFDNISITEFEDWLTGLENLGMIERFLSGEERYYFIKNFEKHQRVNRPNWDRCNPSPPDETTLSVTDNGQDTDRSVQDRIGKDRIGKDRSKDILSGKNKAAVEKIISCLNQATGKNFTTKNKMTNRHIIARLNEGKTVGDFEKVITIKTAKWKNDPKMQDYLRPETLFGTKMESYLNEKPAQSRTQGLREVGEQWLRKQNTQDS